jgi:hypothetical protein
MKTLLSILFAVLFAVSCSQSSPTATKTIIDSVLVQEPFTICNLSPASGSVAIRIGKLEDGMLFCNTPDGEPYDSLGNLLPPLTTVPVDSCVTVNVKDGTLLIGGLKLAGSNTYTTVGHVAHHGEYWDLGE